MQNFENIPALRDVVLVGGGHSHVQVLKSFGMHPEPGVRLTLISRNLQTPYSGMLPGCLSGEYTQRDIHIMLAPLCRFAGARMIQAEVTGVDPESQRVLLADRPSLQYDILSLNSGAVPMPPYQQAVTVKPISRFLPKWYEITRAIRNGQHLAIVGGGAGGVELALAARRALPPGINIHLVGACLLPGHGAGAVRRVLAQFRRHDIRWRQGRAVGEADGDLILAEGSKIPADYVLWVTHVGAPAWIPTAGLQSDANGFVSVDRHLRSVSHSNIFAAGDVAHLVGQERAKSGVYAVRAGPVLSANLRRAATGRPLKVFRAQRRHLALLGNGHGGAIASRGNWSAQGKSWWRLKDWIDRKFILKYNELPEMHSASPQLPKALQEHLPEQLARCGGCGAKLAADPLRRVLARLPQQSSVQVDLGIGDDAALLKTAPGTLLTVDGFRAMLDDPYLFGRIAAHHSLNDIFAMSARPTAGLALVTVPLMAERMMEEELFQLLSGATDVLNAHDTPLVGGHSAEGLELGVGLTVIGEPGPHTLLKGGAQTGDRLILCKALGTGVILAAAMQGHAEVQSLHEAQQSMDLSNASAADVFSQADAHAMTDVTGFGLAGHLGEMLRASGKGVRLELSRVPLLPGVCELFEGSQSSLQQANELALGDFQFDDHISPGDPHLRVLADPQTSGGLLAAIPADKADACVRELLKLGYKAADIGEILDPHGWFIV